MTYLFRKNAAGYWQQRLEAPKGVNGGSQSNVITAPWSGYYIAYAQAVGGEYSNGWQLACEIHAGGFSVYENYGTGQKPGHPQWNDSFVRVYMPQMFIGAGSQIYFIAYNTSGVNDNGNLRNEMYIAFMASPDYPRG